MKLQRSRQRGISFIGLVFVGAVLASAGVIAAQVFPTYMEYQAIGKAVQKSKDGSSVADIRASFDRATEVDDIKSIKGKDLDVSKDGDKVVISFAYTREIHLAGPAYLVMKYSGQSK